MQPSSVRKMFAAIGVDDKEGIKIVNEIVANGLDANFAFNGQAESLKGLLSVFEPCIYSHSIGQHIFALTNYSMPEARLYLKGGEVLAAIPYHQVQGANFAQKLNIMNSMPIPKFIEFVKNVVCL